MFLLQKQSQIHKSQRKRKGNLRGSLDVVIAAITVPFWSSRPCLAIPSPSHFSSSSRHRGARPSVVPAISNHVPNVFSRIAELPARYARTQAKVANADSVVLDVVCKVVIALGHRADEHADALFRSQV